jgi:UDP-N-acetylmuramoyl-tripeptide--D-alanyl-D-alanine ligase
MASGWIRRVLGLEETPGPSFESVAIDSREVEEGALFFALSGARHDGFDFLDEVAEQGAAGAVVPRGRPLPDLGLEWFPVDDPRQAMARLAAGMRQASEATVVGVTGSSGKTTVKEMLAEALGGAPRVYRSRGNLNSQIGLPLSILNAQSEASVWVLEMGTNAPGEIARLVEVAAPDHALVTTVGPAHLEAFEDVEGVLEEKLDLVRGAAGSGRVVVGERPPELAPAARRIRPDTVVAGLGEDADWRPDRWAVEADHVVFDRSGERYRVEAGGEHHLRDAVMAAAMAEGLGSPPAAVAREISDFRPLGLRGALRRAGELTLVADCYNANPESFDAAVDYCVEAFPDRPMAAAVGSMLELGRRSGRAHRQVARRLLDAGFSPVAATGEFVPAFRALLGEEGSAGDGQPRRGASRVVFAEGAEEAGRELAALLDGDEVVLVKGSRGAGLEDALEVLEEAFGAGGGDAGGNPGPAGRDGAPGADDADRTGGGASDVAPARRSGGTCGAGDAAGEGRR